MKTKLEYVKSMKETHAKIKDYYFLKRNII